MNGPQHFTEAERLLAEVETYGDSSNPVAVAWQRRAQVHATLALAAATALSAPIDGEIAGLNVEEYDTWYKATRVKATPETAAPAKPVTVYRAEHDSIVMGLYTTAAEARKHCEAEERRSWSTGTALAFVWIEDDEDRVAELVATLDGDPERPTGYVVTALEVASEYDPEADA